MVKSFLVKFAAGPCLPSTTTSTSTSCVLTRNTDGSSVAEQRGVQQSAAIESGRIHARLSIDLFRRQWNAHRSSLAVRLVLDHDTQGRCLVRGGNGIVDGHASGQSLAELIVGQAQAIRAD